MLIDHVPMAQCCLTRPACMCTSAACGCTSFTKSRLRTVSNSTQANSALSLVEREGFEAQLATAREAAEKAQAAAAAVCSLLRGMLTNLSVGVWGCFTAACEAFSCQHLCPGRN